VQRVAATSNPAPDPRPEPAAAQAAPPAAEPPQTAAAPAAVAVGERVTVEASDLTWISLRDASGKATLSRLFAAGDTQTFDAPEGTILRIGNAAGVKILVNGNSIAPLGPQGKVRELVFRNGSYRVVGSD
jgi:cytoskeleton protein RodZ